MSRIILQKNTLRLMAAFLVALLLMGLFPRVSAASGSCGSSLNWSLEDGTLTITGSGAMDNFPESTMAPWHSQRQEINKVILPEGLTSIGSLAFYDCTALTAVSIPDSVTSIGSYAFFGCTAMTMLNLGSGVKTIGEAAFSDCVSLVSLTLPASLQSIGLKGFYRCESISSLVVPSSVNSLGISAFAYCKSLIRADVRANIAVVPEYLFYGCNMLTMVSLPETASDLNYHAFRGCEQLSTVYYQGENQTPEQIEELISKDLPVFQSGTVLDQTFPGSSISGNITSNADGSITVESSKVTQGSDSTVTSTTTTVRPEDGSTSSADGKIDIVVTGPEGWNEIRDTVERELDDMEDTIESSQGGGKVDINIFVQDSEEIDQEFIGSLAGKNVNVTITTQDGSVWKLKGSELVKAEDLENAPGYDLRYELTFGSPALCEELGVTTCYTLKFLAPAQVNAEVLFLLNSKQAMQNATLLQKLDKEFTQVQTTVVDGEGYAHFYLAAVDDETEYCIAINLPQPETEAIIPQPLMEEYGAEQIAPIEYEITGRTSSWGMNISQVTWIMVGVLGGAVVIVGIVMFALNKRKLKHGYVPDWDGDDE